MEAPELPLRYLVKVHGGVVAAPWQLGKLPIADRIHHHLALYLKGIGVESVKLDATPLANQPLMAVIHKPLA